MSERQKAWYWTKVDDCWGALEWDGESWAYGDKEFGDEYLDHIGSRIPTPDEPWQTVPVEPTIEMYDRALHDEAHGSDTAEAVWVSMLAAAPKPGGE